MYLVPSKTRYIYITYILIFLLLLEKESGFIFLGQVLEKYTNPSCKTEFVKLKTLTLQFNKNINISSE